MPTLIQVRDAVDARLTNLWQNQIIPRQDVYFAARGRYWQGLLTTNIASLPNNLATGSVLEVAPNLNAKPTDQAESWSGNSINLEPTIPMALAIDAYHGPLGRGYVGLVWARHLGNTYHRAQNRGPETWRTFDWVLLS